MQNPNLRPLIVPPPTDNAERTSVASVAKGAVIIARTGELFLDSSALRLVDGDPLSSWMPPPRDLPQSITIRLAARTRIEKVGIRAEEELPAKNVLVESSVDGATFKPLVTMTASKSVDEKWFDVSPTEANVVRMTALDRWQPNREIRIHSLLVRGTELEAPHPGDIAGCWSVNGTTASFVRSGARVSGVLVTQHEPIEFDGGFDGRTYRFNWIRGNDYGYALMSVSADGKKLNGIEWHEEAIPLFFGESWFGTRPERSEGSGGEVARGPCLPPDQVPRSRSGLAERYLHRASRYSLFGLRFRDDATLDREASAETLAWLTRFCKENPVQLIGYEFRRANANENRAFAKRELDALLAELRAAGATNVTFVAKGSDSPRQVPESDAARAIYSTVDVEIRR